MILFVSEHKNQIDQFFLIFTTIIYIRFLSLDTIIKLCIIQNIKSIIKFLEHKNQFFKIITTIIIRLLSLDTLLQ